MSPFLAPALIGAFAAQTLIAYYVQNNIATVNKLDEQVRKAETIRNEFLTESKDPYFSIDEIHISGQNRIVYSLGKDPIDSVVVKQQRDQTLKKVEKFIPFSMYHKGPFYPHDMLSAKE